MAQATAADLPIGALVSFDTYAPAVLGTIYRDCTVMSHLDAETVRELGRDPHAKHVAIYPTLPAGETPNDYKAYLYVKLKLLNGTIDYIGIPWVRKETIKSRQVKRAVITVEDVGPDDVREIIEQLSAAGYKSAKVELK